MVQIKIECPCGQHYAFDVEPIHNRMPSAIQCPSCGDDGTAAANEIIARQTAAPGQPVKPRLAASPQSHAPASVHHDARSLGLVSREQAESEARAKISWGDDPNEVIRYLMLQGFHAVEAKDLVDDCLKERLKAVRAKGVKQIITGAILIAIPVITLIAFLTIGRISIYVMGLTVLSGAYGVYLLVNGCIIAIAPKVESGDVADDD